MNKFQKAIQNFARKALGFPAWTGGTTDILPGSWGSLEYGGYNEAGALALSTVYGCCRVLCQTIGSMPWHIYTTDKSGTRHKAPDHPLYEVLHLSPNAYMTSMEFRETLILNFCLTGNAYAEKIMLGSRVVALNPLRSDWMVPKMKRGGAVLPGPELIYEYRPPTGAVRDYASGEILHLKNFSHDGIRGISPIREHAMRHAMYTDAYATNFMRNQGRPSGVLESKKPRPKDPDYNTRLSDDWKKLYGGDNAGSTAVLWDEMTYKAISISPDDAQYIQTKKLTQEIIAGEIFGVPGNYLGHTDKTATYASAEQFAIDFRRNTVSPLAERLEQVFNKQLFATQPGTFCELDLDGLMRGDSKTQAEYLRTLTDGGVMTRNEARRTLNLPERPEADQLTVRSYEIDLNALPKLSQDAKPGLSQNDIRKAALLREHKEEIE